MLREFGVEGLSSSQVSSAAALLDEELEAWRNRLLGEIRYLSLDANFEEMRAGGVVRDATVLSAIGIGPDERRRVLGVSVSLLATEVRWRGFLNDLVARGMRGVEFHRLRRPRDLRAARRAVLGAATWQRCQFHLAANAIHHAHAADVQDRDGAADVLKAIRRRRPWPRHVFADGGYAGRKLRKAIACHGDWTIEIINRSDAANGFKFLPRRWVVERTLAWLGRCRRLAKDWKMSVSSSTAWALIPSSRMLTRRTVRYCYAR